jgi:hypothetical protein
MSIGQSLSGESEAVASSSETAYLDRCSSVDLDGNEPLEVATFADFRFDADASTEELGELETDTQLEGKRKLIRQLAS